MAGTKQKLVTVAGIQMRASANPQGNLRKAEALVRLAAKKGAQIICLPELFRTPYFPQHKKAPRETLAEGVPGESSDLFSAMAREYRVVLIVPVYEKTARARYYNSAVVIDEKGLLLPTYRKTHIPQDPLFYEKDYFEPGDSGYQVYKTRAATFSVLICYDQWYPEAARLATLAGADIIFYPTAIGTIVGQGTPDGDWHGGWETVMLGHAIANATHVVAVNRVGREDQLRFWGQSFACDAFGALLERASATEEEVMIVKLDLSHNRVIRKGWGFLRNRRPDTYQSLSTSDSTSTSTSAIKPARARKRP